MSQFLLTVADTEVAFIRKLLRNLPGVRLEKVKEEEKRAATPVARPKAAPYVLKKPLTPEQQEWVDDLKQALVDVERHQRGEIELRPIEELMRELDEEHKAYWGESASS